MLEARTDTVSKPPMKHVVILSDTLPPEYTDEAGRTAWALGQGLLAAGQRVTFVTATDGPSGRESRQGVPVHRVHSRYATRWRAWFGLMNPQTLWPLNRLLRQLQPDVVHAHNVATHLSYHSLVIGRFAGAATVYTAHNALPIVYRHLPVSWDGARPRCGEADYRLPFVYNLRREGLRWNPARNLSIRHTMRYYTDVRVAVSGALKAALEANRLSPFHVVHPGVDLRALDVPDAAVTALRQRWRLGGRRVLLAAAEDAGGWAQALATLECVRAHVPEAALVLLTERVAAARAQIATAPALAPHVRVSGALSVAERAAAYRLAELALVLSAHFAPFPLANVEAMACGAPPITSCFGGGAEAVRDGEIGFVVNPHDADALAERALRLLRDAALRQRMAAAGRAHAAAHFSLHAYAARTLEIYEQALARRREKA